MKSRVHFIVLGFIYRCSGSRNDFSEGKKEKFGAWKVDFQTLKMKFVMGEDENRKMYRSGKENRFSRRRNYIRK